MSHYLADAWPDHDLTRPRSRPDLAALGVTRSELGAAGWRRPYRNVHVLGTGADPVRQRILEAAALLPGTGAVGGWAAAYLHGVGELDGIGPAQDELPVLLCMPEVAHVKPRAGVRLLRSDLRDDDVVLVDDVPATSPVRTAVDLARLSPLRAAVEALDTVLRAGLVTRRDIGQSMPRWRRMRGVPVLREALDLADPRTASRPETRLRLVWVLDAALPRPLVNPTVVDSAGWPAGSPDLMLDDIGLVAEYDGQYHRALEQHTEDNAREERLERLGLVVVRATSVDLGPHRARLVGRLLDGRSRAATLGRPRRWSVQRG